MKNITKLTASIILSTAVLAPSSSFAFGFGNLISNIPGLGGDSSETSKGSSVNSVVGQTNTVMVDFVTSMNLFNQALGLEKNADLEKTAAGCVTGKLCFTENQMEKIVSDSEALAQKLEANKKNGITLSATAKETYNKGLLSYGTGVFKSTIIIIAVSELSSQMVSNPIALIASADVIKSLSTSVPPTFSAFKNASGAIYDYASFNGIEKPEIAVAE